MINSSTSTSSGHWRKVRLSLGVLALLFIVMECVLHSLPGPLPARSIRRTFQDMESLPAPEIQIYGESVTSGAVNDWVLADALGMDLSQIRNDSVTSTSAFFAYLQMKRQIEKGRVPPVLILGYVSRSYTVPMVPKLMSHVASASDIAEISLDFRPPLETVLQGLAGKVSCLYRYRTEYNDLLKQGFGKKGLATYSLPTVGILERQENLPRSLDAASSGQDAAQAAAMMRFYDLQFAPPPEMQRSLKSLFQLARQHHIRVLLLSMPKPEELFAAHEKSGFNREYDQFMNGFVNEGAAEWLIREQQALPATDFMDGVHLTRAAGFKFSQQVASRLKTSLQ